LGRDGRALKVRGTPRCCPGWAGARLLEGTLRNHPDRVTDPVAIDVCPIDLHCFALAKQILGSRVEYHHMGVYELDEKKLGGKFDLVLFPGVFYHLRHILMSLDNIWNILEPDGYMIMETHVCDNYFVLGDGTVTTLKDIDPRLVDTPVYRFYRRNELNSVDWSNWFGGNVAAIMDCLGSAGFKAELLATWSSRAAFRADRIDTSVREWEQGSYEGTRFVYNDDGTWNMIWHEPPGAVNNRNSFTEAGQPGDMSKAQKAFSLLRQGKFVTLLKKILQQASG